MSAKFHPTPTKPGNKNRPRIRRFRPVFVPRWALKIPGPEKDVRVRSPPPAPFTECFTGVDPFGSSVGLRTVTILSRSTRRSVGRRDWRRPRAHRSRRRSRTCGSCSRSDVRRVASLPDAARGHVRAAERPNVADREGFAVTTSRRRASRPRLVKFSSVYRDPVSTGRPVVPGRRRHDDADCAREAGRPASIRACAT